MKTHYLEINATIGTILICLLLLNARSVIAQYYSYCRVTYYYNKGLSDVSYYENDTVIYHAAMPDSQWIYMIPLLCQHMPEEVTESEVHPVYNAKGYRKLLQIFPDYIFHQIAMPLRREFCRLLDGTQRYIIICITVNGNLSDVWIETRDIKYIFRIKRSGRLTYYCVIKTPGKNSHRWPDQLPSYDLQISGKQ